MKKSKFDELWLRLPFSIRDACDKCEQHPKYHPEGNVTNHIRLVFEHAEKTYPENVELQLAAIFHDLGKPETFMKRVVNNEIKISAYGHEFKATKFLRKYFKLYSDISTNFKKVEEICLNHMKATQYIRGTLKKPAKRKAFENLKYFDDLIKFAECDKAGKQKK